MAREKNRRSGLGWHIGRAIFSNLLAGLISTTAFFLTIKVCDKTIAEETTSKLIASVIAIIFWCISYGLAVIGVRYNKPFRKNLKYLGYYFPPTTLFVWAIEQRKGKLAAQEEVARLKRIIVSWPLANIVERIINPVSRKEGLEEVINSMDDMTDHDLAIIIERIIYCVEDILELAENGEKYNLFRELMEKLSLYEPDGHTQTFESLLWLMSEIYEVQPEKSFRVRVQKDMITPLKHIIWRADEAHLNALRRVIEKVMFSSQDDHELARALMEMLHTLDPKARALNWQLIFDQCKERAFLFPEDFGHDFMEKINELGHKVFWLEFHSLRDIWLESPTPGRRGLIASNQSQFYELCSKVFAITEDLHHSGIRHARVFKRLKGDFGKVRVECLLPNGQKCCCDGESLSLRGFFSRDCIRKTNERLQSTIIPILEHNRQFNLTSSIAKLHIDESGNEVQGRGIFFEDAEEDVVESIYEYISQY